MQVAHPTQGHQQNGDHVVCKHLPEILPLDIDELRRSERPVECHRDHVVPPDIVGHRLVWIAVPAVFDVPQPGFVPHNDATEDKAVRVVDASPRVFAKLNQRRRFVLGSPTAPPSLDLSFGKLGLLGQFDNLKVNNDTMEKVIMEEQNAGCDIGCY